MAGDTQWKSRLPPELKWMAKVPSSKLLLTGFLKYQIQQMLTQLSEITGIESVLLTANRRDKKGGHLGSSPLICRFLDEEKDLVKKFVNFCTKRKYSAKDISKEASLYLDMEEDGKLGTAAAQVLETGDNDGKRVTITAETEENGDSVVKVKVEEDVEVDVGNSGNDADQTDIDVSSCDVDSSQRLDSVNDCPVPVNVYMNTANAVNLKGTKLEANELYQRENNTRINTFPSVKPAKIADSRSTSISTEKLGKGGNGVYPSGSNLQATVLQPRGDNTQIVETSLNNTTFRFKAATANLSRYKPQIDSSIMVSVSTEKLGKGGNSQISDRGDKKQRLEEGDDKQYSGLPLLKPGLDVEDYSVCRAVAEKYMVNKGKRKMVGKTTSCNKTRGKRKMLEKNTSCSKNGGKRKMVEKTTSCSKNGGKRKMVEKNTSCNKTRGKRKMVEKNTSCSKQKRIDEKAISEDDLYSSMVNKVKDPNPHTTVAERLLEPAHVMKADGAKAEGSKTIDGASKPYSRITSMLKKNTYRASKNLMEIKDNPPPAGRSVVERSFANIHFCNFAVEEDANKHRKHRKKPLEWKRNLSSNCDYYDLDYSRNISKEDTRVATDYEEVLLNSDSNDHDNDNDRNDYDTDDENYSRDDKDNCGNDDENDRHDDNCNDKDNRGNDDENDNDRRDDDCNDKTNRGGDNDDNDRHDDDCNNNDNRGNDDDDNDRHDEDSNDEDNHGNDYDDNDRSDDDSDDKDNHGGDDDDDDEDELERHLQKFKTKKSSTCDYNDLDY